MEIIPNSRPKWYGAFRMYLETKQRNDLFGLNSLTWILGEAKKAIAEYHIRLGRAPFGWTLTFNEMKDVENNLMFSLVI